MNAPAAAAGGRGAAGLLDLTRPVRVFACDIDGCLVPVGHQGYDLAALSAMAELNRASADDPSVPALTIVSGRPHSYVDAIMQFLGVRIPASFENGAGLARLQPYEAWLQPGLHLGLDDLRRFEGLVRARPHLLLQFGKMASATVFPREATRTAVDVADELDELVREHALALRIDPTVDSINVLLPGIDKEAGFVWLCEELGLAPEEVAGIGDSVGDVGWLRRCGASFAPANAAAEVRAAVTQVMSASDAGAALAAYRALVEANRGLG